MKIINKVEQELFGELLCFADEEEKLLFLGKQTKMNFLSEKEQDVVKESYIIHFSLEDEEWALVKVNRKDSPSYFYLNSRDEVQVVEMDYR